MKTKFVNIFWGFILILVSGVLLAQALGYIDFDTFSQQFWVMAFGVASAAFFFSYFLNGVRNWGWLFPACIFAALAATTWMVTSDMTGSFLGAPILAAIALPFYVGFALDRKSWGLLIPAFVMTVITLITFLADRVPGEWIGALVLFSIGLPFLVAFLADRRRWWALIPAGIMIVLAVVTLLPVFVSGEWIGAVVMYAIALPFLVVYLLDRSRRWALIPAGVLAVVGTIPLFSLFLGAEVSGAAVMFLFSLPFFIVYFWSKDNWWALIPAGVFASIGVVVVLSLFIPGESDLVVAGTPFAISGLMQAVLFLGLALTFGILWLRRKNQPTNWAKYPTIGLLAAAVLAFAFGEKFNDYWPAMVMLVIGVMLLLNAFRKKSPAA